jgi:DNA end-binding protein Ku
MRAIWKGAVSFGLVSVPVKLYAATESHDISFRQVHAKDGGRIKYQRVCSVDGEEVAYADIAKGYETQDGQMVVLDDDDLAELPASSSREISVEKFVPSDQVDPMWLEKSYYLEPDKSAAKPYALLREALKEVDRVAIVTVSIRTRMTTAVLRVRDNVIVMQTMLWPDEVRKPDFAGLDATEHAAKPQELKMAKLLVDTLAGDYDPDEYEDDYQKAVEALVQAKLEGGEVKAPEEPKKSTGEVVDLLAALQRSVEAAKTSRGESSPAADADTSDDAEDTEDEETPASRSTAKKSTAKKTADKKASKKAPAKKAAAKKTAKKSTSKKAAAKKAS